MTEIIKETIKTNESRREAPVSTQVSNTTTVEQVIYFLFGALEVLLVFRLLFKLAGASFGSAFVRMIYGVTGIFIWPFEGIFRRAVSEGLETASVLEPSTLVAIIAYALLAWGIVKLVRISSGERE